MSFLERVKLIRKIINGSRYDEIGHTDIPVSFFEEARVRFAVISDSSLAKAILESQSFSAVNHLESFLPEGDASELEYVLRFLRHSPEFLDGEDHRKMASRSRRIIEGYYQSCNTITSGVLVDPLNDWRHSVQEYSSQDLSKYLLSLYFTRAGQSFHRSNAFVFKSTHITEKFGFFSAAPRVSRLIRFNQDIANHIEQADLQSASEDEQFMLLLLRIMGSAPLNSTLTSCLNFLVERHQNGVVDSEIPNELQGKQAFSRFLPTRFSLRRAKEDIRIEGYDFKQNDILYVFLVDAAGCPIRKVVSMPFGAGKHFCPGHRVSEQIIQTCLEAVLHTKAHVNCLISESKTDNIGAFLSFE